MLSLLLPVALGTTLISTPALADEAATADAPKPFQVSGKYVIWGLSQHNFMLGADHPLNDAEYVTQMLRVQARAQRKHYGVLARLDAAQGWWGADNSPNTSSSVTTDDTGAVSSSTAYNADKLFGSKDTNYEVHVDLAYAWFEIPTADSSRALLTARAGRQQFKLGHKLVVDEDYDGVQVELSFAEAIGLEGWYAKVSEGTGSFTAPTGALMSDTDAMSDADLFGGIVHLTPAMEEGSKLAVDAFGMFYNDNSGVDDTGTQSSTYLPDGYGYAEARFHPNLSQVMAFGLSADSTLPVAAGLQLAAEFDFLTGSDDVANADSSGGNLDINNGELSGWNAYLDATQRLDVGVPMRVAALFGMGSGDDDVTSGKGNINRIQTMGFWHLTNVWEDSVMPDIEGISPQGLGSPVSRGYRELENTTAIQGRVGFTPDPKVDAELSYTYLMATQPIHGFDASGVPTGTTSSDLGMEIDLDVSVKLYKGLSYKALAGVFLPGEGAGLLINGNTDALDPAWEVKQVAVAAF